MSKNPLLTNISMKNTTIKQGNNLSVSMADQSVDAAVSKDVSLKRMLKEMEANVR